MQRTTEPIKRVLANNFDVKVAMKPYQTIGQLFPKLKEKIEQDQGMDPVYSIPCADFNKDYI